MGSQSCEESAKADLQTISAVASEEIRLSVTPQLDMGAYDSSRRAVLLAGAAALTTGIPFRAANSRDETAPTNGVGRDLNSKDKMQPDTALKGFDYRRITTAGATINVASRGKGPPLLLLHGYPETHHMWHKVAPALAEEFTVVCTDLRGYGDSSKPEGALDHSNYSKRAMATDMIEVMAALGHREFLLAGHDRGGRVAYRLALDHPGAVKRLALFDIVSTKAVYEQVTMPLATAYFHWYFLIQPRPVPETLIGHDPGFWLNAIFGRLSASSPTAFSDATVAEYLRAFGTPEGHTRVLRGLSRRRHHRPGQRPRRRERCTQDHMSDSHPLGDAQCGGEDLSAT